MNKEVREGKKVESRRKVPRFDKRNSESVYEGGEFIKDVAR